MRRDLFGRNSDENELQGCEEVQMFEQVQRMFIGGCSVEDDGTTKDMRMISVCFQTLECIQHG